MNTVATTPALATEFVFEGFFYLRTLYVNNEPCFVATDVCKILEIRNASQALSRLDEDEKGIISTDTLGGVQNLLVVSESGLYTMILGSRKPQAKPFKRWVTHEVIPAIRKTGTYSMAPALTEDEQIANALILASNKLKAIEGRAKELESKVAVLTPKADAFDRWVSSNMNYSVGDVAKALNAAGANIGRNRLFAYLAHEAKWIFFEGGQYHAYQLVVDQGLVYQRMTSYTDPHTGWCKSKITILISPKGAKKLAQLFGVLAEDVAENLETGDLAA